MAFNVAFPSGMVLEMRPMQTSDVKHLANKQAMRDGSTFTKVMAACSVSVVSPGPYNFALASKPVWGQVLVGDRQAGLMQVRSKSFAKGEEYEYQEQCPEMGCRTSWDQPINLLEIAQKKITDAAVAALKDNNRFETVLPVDGRRIWVKQITCDLQAATFKILSDCPEDEQYYNMIAARVDEIEGLEAHQIKYFIEKTAMQDSLHLVDTFEEIDCGLVSTIHPVCPKCEARIERELPIGASFFMPKRKKVLAAV